MKLRFSHVITDTSNDTRSVQVFLNDQYSGKLRFDGMWTADLQLSEKMGVDYDRPKGFDQLLDAKRFVRETYRAKFDAPRSDAADRRRVQAVHPASQESLLLPALRCLGAEDPRKQSRRPLVGLWLRRRHDRRRDGDVYRHVWLLDKG